VERDLGPYVCLLEDCETPDKLYRQKTRWLEHMTKEDISLRGEDERSCPLCGASGASTRLLPHVQAHLLSLALLCLPQTEYFAANSSLMSSAASGERIRPESKTDSGDLGDWKSLSWEVKDGGEERRSLETDNESGNGLLPLCRDTLQGLGEPLGPHERESVQGWIDSLPPELRGS